MAAPGATTGWDVIFEINDGISGFKVNLWWQGTKGQQALYTDTATLASQIRNCMSPLAAIVGIRYTQFNTVQAGRAASIFTQDEGAGCGPGNNADTTFNGVSIAQPVWDAVNMSFLDSTYTYRRTLQLRGLSSRMADWDPNGGTALTPIGKSRIFALMSTISNGNGPSDPINANNDPNPGSNLGLWSIRARSQPGSLVQQITAAAPDPTGCFTVLTVPSNIGYSPGNPIHIHGVKGCGVIGLNGDGVVVSLKNASGVVDAVSITVNRKPGCCVMIGTPYAILPTVPPNTGIWQYTFTLQAIQRSEPTNRLVLRPTGRPNLLTKGRRKSCRVRG